jgi:putative phosphoribosyl transferase
VITRFENRFQAGQHLARELNHYASVPGVVVLALPRGGVPVGYEVATHLSAPLDVFLVRKLGVPGHEEFAMGALASGGVTLLNEEVVRQLRLTREEIDQVIEMETQELQRRERTYGHQDPPLDLREHTVILVDDGLATGSTMKAAVQAVYQQNPSRVVVAVPVAPKNTCEEFERIVDEFVCVLAPEDFFAVGQWYEDFAQTTDEEVRELLERATTVNR